MASIRTLKMMSRQKAGDADGKTSAFGREEGKEEEGWARRGEEQGVISQMLLGGGSWLT
jgi:hypothetical protein